MQNTEFPLVIERALNDFSQNEALPVQIENHFSNIEDKLNKNGAILFKGYDIDCEAALAECVNSVPGAALDYVDGNSPRTKLTDKVYTSTEHPPEYFISLHNELSYSHSWPKYLFFCCATPAATGGSTVIADGRALIGKLPEEIVNEFRQKGVQYIRNLHGGKGSGPSWQDTFETDDQATVEELCSARQLNFEWRDNGVLHLTQCRPATYVHPKTGEEVWFNQADQFHPSTNPPEVYEALCDIYEGRMDQLPQHATFGTGEEISIEALTTIRDVTAAVTREFVWERGDLLMLDNVLASHGRTPFTGKRKILVSMSS